MHFQFFLSKNNKNISQFAIGNETHRTFEIMLTCAFIAILFYQMVCTSADRMVSIWIHWLGLQLVSSFLMFFFSFNKWKNAPTHLPNKQLQRVQMHGVPIERHFVTTDDGYILGVYRLPRLSNSSVNSQVAAKPIFFIHGQISSSQDFVAYRNSSAGKQATLSTHFWCSRLVSCPAKCKISLSYAQNSILFLGSRIWCLVG